MGKLALHDDVSKLLTENLLPYTIVEDPERRTVAVKTQTGEVVSAEALVVRLWLRADTDGMTLRSCGAGHMLAHIHCCWLISTMGCFRLNEVSTGSYICLLSPSRWIDDVAGRYPSLCKANYVCCERRRTGVGLCDCGSAILWPCAAAGPL